MNRGGGDRRWGAAAGVAGAALLAGCAGGPPALTIDTTYTARSQDSRVQFLVIHHTAEDLPSSLRILTQQEVSSHYLVTDEQPPRVYRLVDESRRAWHAGLSSWRGNTRLNAASIGIEIVHPGEVRTAQGTTWPPFDAVQIDLVVALVQDIVRRHAIRPEHVVGHSDIAPQRKVDPGPTFPWKRLADLGLVPWPDAARVQQARAAFEATPPDVAWFQRALAEQGYEVGRGGVLDEPTRKVIRAFQMKYRPARFDGEPDVETAALLEALNAQARR